MPQTQKRKETTQGGEGQVEFEEDLEGEQRKNRVFQNGRMARTKGVETRKHRANLANLR